VVVMKNASTGFVVDTSKSPYAKLFPIPIKNVQIIDEFWAPRLKIVREVTLPSQYRLCEKTGRFANFRRAAGKEHCNFQGLFFNDSDVYKWIEAVAYSLAGVHDNVLLNLVQIVIPLIMAVQDKDGYLNTYFTFERRNERWTNLKDMHELYCAGHLIQAAISYYRFTGDRRLLDVACRVADNIGRFFGAGKRLGVPGHPEVEMALVELYRTTGKEEYLDMARFFIDNRGKGLVGGSAYHIDHRPFRELTEIAGHAVRSIYLNCGATDVYMETGEKALWDALTKLWSNMTNRKMYITGGVGSRHEGEAFGEDYELPNVRAYAETCAAIANVMWNWRMLLISGDAKFTDVLELALYNCVLSGISLDGQQYFYVNPLEDNGHHKRQNWFECACCPPNIARLLTSLPGYFYSLSKKGVWVHLYASNIANVVVDGMNVTITQKTRYPWEGDVDLVMRLEKMAAFSLFLRIPNWCQKPLILINGIELSDPIKRDCYVEIHRLWEDGDTVHVSMPMFIEQIIANSNIIENNDKVALKRGPIVYCIEQVDNPNIDLKNLILPAEPVLEAKWKPDLLNGVVVIEGEAFVIEPIEQNDNLYFSLSETKTKIRSVKFTAIPYFTWANREQGPMKVWIRSSTFLSSINWKN